LLERAKRLAAQRKTTLKQVLEDALREELRRHARPAERRALQTHTVDGRGLQRGLSWDDWQSLRDLAYEGRGG
jgi:phosphoketolase